MAVTLLNRMTASGAPNSSLTVYAAVATGFLTTDFPPGCTNPYINYTWAFTQLPDASQLGGADIAGNRSVRASFVPDVPGQYTVQLTAAAPCAASAANVSLLALCDPSPVVVASLSPAPWGDHGGMCLPLLRADATASQDAIGNPLNDTWTVTGRPPISNATFSPAFAGLDPNAWRAARTSRLRRDIRRRGRRASAAARWQGRGDAADAVGAPRAAHHLPGPSRRL